MGKRRRHLWRVTFQRFREEKNGRLTPTTPPDYLVFDDKQVDKTSKSGWDFVLVRPGREGIVDALIGRMREIRKSKRPYKQGVKVFYDDIDSTGSGVS